MKSEAKKTFQHGFDLTEQEFRRIYDALCQQMERSCQGCLPHSTFEIKFKNGVVANPVTIDEILALENIGSESILRLSIKLDDGKPQPASSIKLDFRDVDNDYEPGYESISYTIAGDDQNWVFITSSQLDERISRIKKFALNQYGSRRNRLFPSVLLPIIMLLTLLPFLIAVPRLTQSENQKIDAIETQWRNGEFKDEVEVIFAIERVRVNERGLGALLLPLGSMFAAPTVFLFLVTSGSYFWARYFPVYNFLWGDYVRYYEKRRSVARFVLIGVIFTIIISVFANYISALLGIGK